MRKAILLAGIFLLIISTIGCTQTSYQPSSEEPTETTTIIFEEESSSEDMGLIEDSEVSIGELI